MSIINAGYNHIRVDFSLSKRNVDSFLNQLDMESTTTQKEYENKEIFILHYLSEAMNELLEDVSDNLDYTEDSERHDDTFKDVVKANIDLMDAYYHIRFGPHYENMTKEDEDNYRDIIKALNGRIKELESKEIEVFEELIK